MFTKSRLIRDAFDRESLIAILIISVLTSSMTLLIPIAAQTLMNFVAFGKLLRPVVTICLIVLVLMIGASILSVWQSIIIEMLQQRFLVMTSLRIAKKFLYASQTKLDQEHKASLVNRFFEIITIRKSIATWLLYGFDMALQFIFGFILLVIYHPIFILFDLIIIFGLILSIWPLFKKSMILANKECTAKHTVAGWLEDALAQRSLFQFGRHSNFVLRQMDKKLIRYLSNRGHYFQKLIKLKINLYALSIVSTILLFGGGAYLAIINQLSLGQLVAAELILGMMIASLRRLPAMMENYYDLSASMKKIQGILNMTSMPANPTHENPLLALTENDVQLEFDHFILSEHHDTTPLNALAKPKSPLVVLTQDKHESNHLIHAILGVCAFSGTIRLNDTVSTTDMLTTLRHDTLLVDKPSWFMGTVKENLVLNYTKESFRTSHSYLEQLNLLTKIHELPEQFETYIPNAEAIFTEDELIKLTLIRSYIICPKLLLLDHVLDHLHPKDLEVIKTMLYDMPHTTVIVTTSHHTVRQIFTES